MYGEEMNPEDLCAKLEALHDGELPEAQARAVRAHMDGCPSCRLKLAQLAAMEQALKPGIPAADISAAVMSRIAALDARGRRRTPSFFRWWKVPALALASCAVYVLCVESGSLPSTRSQLPSAIASYKETEDFTAMLFGNKAPGNEQLLTMLLEGDKK